MLSVRPRSCDDWRPTCHDFDQDFDVLALEKSCHNWRPTCHDFVRPETLKIAFFFNPIASKLIPEGILRGVLQNFNPLCEKIP